MIMTPQKWTVIKTGQATNLIDFSYLEAWRCAIQEVRYSINSASLDQVWALQPCESGTAGAMVNSNPFLTVSEPIDSVSVRLTFRDGTASQTYTARP